MRTQRMGGSVSWVGAALLALFLIGPTAGACAADEAVFSATFDESLDAAAGAPNRYAASNGVALVPAPGGRGRAARFPGNLLAGQSRSPSPLERQALIYSGSNLPNQKGSISFRIKSSSKSAACADGKCWILSMPPVVGEVYFEVEESGVGLGLVEDAEGALVLTVHRFEKGRLTADYRRRGSQVGFAPPDSAPLRIPRPPAVDPSRFRNVRIAWDQARGTVSLEVDGDRRTAPIAFGDTRFRALIFGSPPRTLNTPGQAGWAGDIDDLVIRGALAPSARVAPIAGPGSGVPPAAVQSQTGSALSTIEQGARGHLDRILQHRRSGGWGPIVALPSGLHFLSAPTLIPYGDRYYNGMGRASSVIVALILLRGYEVLGDARYLLAAREIGDALVRFQTVSGAWPGQVLLVPDGAPIIQNPEFGILKDRVQTMPPLLLWALFDATGDARYDLAATRGIEFLKRAQNASGSWPNRVRLADGRRESMSGLEGAGETNDFATTDAMNLMLIMYRRTGDLDYLERYLRAADWLTRVFQDSGSKGWAKQYDSNDCPITARHHEPIGVGFREMEDVPRTLLEAYRVTRDERYARVLRKWKSFVESIREEKGWYPYYDIRRGKPIKRVGGRLVPADPRERGDFGLSKVLKRMNRLLGPAGFQKEVRPKRTKRAARLERKALRDVKAMDPGFSTWLSLTGPQGPVMTPNNPRVLVLLHALAESTSAADSGKWSDSWRDSDWRNEFGRILPADRRLARIDPAVLASARSRHSVPSRSRPTTRCNLSSGD